MVILYACIIALIRFLEGISWGYSPMLLHQTLDKENVLSLKVTVNLLMMVKQTFRENPHLSEIMNKTDIASTFYSRESFQLLESYRDLNALIDCSHPAKNENTHYLTH